ncbi:glycosyltransferase family 4 protein [Pedobacter nyackensis]|uniref:glycosyltransferase family 4 protein n=1 Tax=Pedobacter nyackensis TaxID=475255 RepID=UPI00293111BC|nr:glycosyltransferase family 4 protein [Pedobacter nyackensis]
MSKRILILSPETFNAAGGIQSMSRTFAHILHEWCQKNSYNLHLYVLNDAANVTSSPYLPPAYFKGFGKNKIWFTLQSIWNGLNAEIVVLSHVNLSFPAVVIRLLRPSCKIWLIAHGTEVWRPLSGWKKTIWEIADRFICVSNFTKDKIITLHHANPAHCTVLNNISDPFIQPPENLRKPIYLLERYGLASTDRVVFTLTRMSVHEKAKGYDQVIRAIGKIRQHFPNLLYILAGPWNKNERERIEQLAASVGLGDNFILVGYIKKEELSDHYLLADVFVLPSKKEGFGIVFTEAMAHGLPIICGNKDGSTDAVCHEGLGTTIDPDDAEALELALRRMLHRSLTAEFRKSIQQEALKHFNKQQYTNTLAKLITNE